MFPFSQQTRVLEKGLIYIVSHPIQGRFIVNSLIKPVTLVCEVILRTALCVTYSIACLTQVMIVGILSFESHSYGNNNYAFV